MLIVLIAESDTDGLSWLARQPAAPADVVTVTPRSRDRARGRTAGAVLITPAAEELPADVLDRIRANTLPCVMSSRPREAGRASAS